MESILGRIVAIVLTLIAVAGVGYVGYTAFEKSRASQCLSDISQVITNTRALFQQSANGYASFTTANAGALINAGVFPGSMVRGGQVVDAWGNTVQLSPGNANNTEATITFGGAGSETVPQCATVVTGLKDFVAMTVGGTTFSQANQPDPVTASTACSGGKTIAVTFQ